MNAFLKVAALTFGIGGALVAVPASAQSYDDDYYGAYGDEYEGDYDAYADAGYGGYCDETGCPEDYYDLPYYDGEIYYAGSWLNGPFYYRDWGGGRQYWIRGGWRSAQYRGGNFRPALGRDWYRSHRGNVARGGWNGWNGGGGRNGYSQRSFSQPRSYSNYSRQDGNRGSFSYGGRGWQGQSQNQGFGQRDFGRRDFDQNRNVGGRNSFRDQSQPAPQVQQQQSQPSPQNWRGRGDFGRWSGQQSQAQQSYPDRSGRVSGGEGRRGGGDGERRGRDR